jgi:hypothetical protein
MKKHLILMAAMLATAGGTALAQSSTVNGAAGGAVTGAIVGGPVGAAVGGVVGAIAGTAIDPPPPPVVTYVRDLPAPKERVILREKIVVGEPLPPNVVVRAVPDNPKYAYAVVNEQRVIIEPSSRRVIQVIN